MVGAAVVLELWERGEGLSPPARALALARAATEDDGLEVLPVGRRDALILQLRRVLAGEGLDATATCPACGEVIEFGLDVAALLARAEAAAAPQPVEAGGFVVAWRSPDSRDVAAAAAAGDVSGAEAVLLERCVTSATGPDGGIAGSALPPAARERVAAAMAEADPLAEVLVDLSCPACTDGFVADLDVAAFVWEEVRARAQRLLHEVAALAAAFGWSEDEVLGLGERRRAEYLRIAGEGQR